MTHYQYLIIGGGMTAHAAIKGIRQVDPNGPIGLISAEADPPYKRPPLSKLDFIQSEIMKQGKLWQLSTKRIADAYPAQRLS